MGHYVSKYFTSINFFYSIWYKILLYASNDIIYSVERGCRKKENFIGVIWDFPPCRDVMLNVSYVIRWYTEIPPSFDAEQITEKKF